jgi:hypothetical protein
MHDLLILAHIVAGTVGLAAGPVAGLARKQQGLHTVAGWTYQICCAVLCTSALALVAMQPALWGFAVIAVLTEAAAVGAVVVRAGGVPAGSPSTYDWCCRPTSRS